MKCVVIIALLGSVSAAENCAAGDPNGACMQDEALSLLQTRAVVQRHTHGDGDGTATATTATAIGTTTATTTTAEQDCFGAHARDSFLVVGGLLVRVKSNGYIVKVKAMTCKATGPDPLSTMWLTPFVVPDMPMTHEVAPEYFAIRGHNHSQVWYKWMMVPNSSAFGGFAVKPAGYSQTLYFPVVPSAFAPPQNETDAANAQWQNDSVALGLIQMFSHSPHVIVNLPMAVAQNTSLTVQNGTWSFLGEEGDVSAWYDYALNPAIEFGWAYAPTTTTAA